MNSSRLRRVSAAPKLAMTMMMTVLRCARRRPNSSASTRRARPPFNAIATSAAIGSAQPKENGPIGVSNPPKIAPSAPAIANAKYAPQATNSPCAKLAKRKIE